MTHHLRSSAVAKLYARQRQLSLRNVPTHGSNVALCTDFYDLTRWQAESAFHIDGVALQVSEDGPGYFAHFATNPGATSAGATPSDSKAAAPKAGQKPIVYKPVE